MSIQSSVLSMMSSIGGIQAQRNANKLKAAKIALGAVTGGVGGAASAALGTMGMGGGSSSVFLHNNNQATVSPQMTAAQMAEQNTANEIAFKKEQQARKDEIRRRLING